eukprot:SAG11_NODE_12883_length_681_cov_0.965636_1_plen_143_part_10
MPLYKKVQHSLSGHNATKNTVLEKQSRNGALTQLSPTEMTILGLHQLEHEMAPPDLYEMREYRIHLLMSLGADRLHAKRLVGRLEGHHFSNSEELVPDLRATFPAFQQIPELMVLKQYPNAETGKANAWSILDFVVNWSRNWT